MSGYIIICLFRACGHVTSKGTRKSVAKVPGRKSFPTAGPAQDSLSFETSVSTQNFTSCFVFQDVFLLCQWSVQMFGTQKLKTVLFFSPLSHESRCVSPKYCGCNTISLVHQNSYLLSLKQLKRIQPTVDRIVIYV